MYCEFSIAYTVEICNTQKKHPRSENRGCLISYSANLSCGLLHDLGNNTGTNGTATLTDSETQTLLDSDGGDQLDLHVDVIAGHAHLNTLGQGDDAGNVGGTEVELGTIVVEEGSMTAAFFLGQDVDLASELGQGVDGTGLAQNLAALDFLLVNATQQSADVVASFCVALTRRRSREARFCASPAPSTP